MRKLNQKKKFLPCPPNKQSASFLLKTKKIFVKKDDLIDTWIFYIFTSPNIMESRLSYLFFGIYSFRSFVDGCYYDSYNYTK